LEINSSPSLQVDSELDHRVKDALIKDIFTIVIPQSDLHLKEEKTETASSFESLVQGPEY